MVAPLSPCATGDIVGTAFRLNFCGCTDVRVGPPCMHLPPRRHVLQWVRPNIVCGEENTPIVCLPPRGGQGQGGGGQQGQGGGATTTTLYVYAAACPRARRAACACACSAGMCVAAQPTGTWAAALPCCRSRHSSLASPRLASPRRAPPNWPRLTRRTRLLPCRARYNSKGCQHERPLEWLPLQ